MKSVNRSTRIHKILWILCFTLLIPLLWSNTRVTAASNNTVYASEKNSDKKTPDVKLNVKKKSIVVDNCYTLVLYNCKDEYKTSFRSSDTDIVTVDREGVVSAKKVGEATITVTVKLGSKTVQTLTCDITVGVPAISIVFTNSKSGIVLVNGKSSLLDFSIAPSNTVEQPKFSSKDTTIATVSSSGRVTAKSVGTTYIFAELANGQYARILVTVIEDEVSSAK